MTTSEHFCLGLLGLGCHRSRALANYIMGLSSSPSLRHPVEITNSLFCHYTYSNLTKVLHFLGLTEQRMLKHLSSYIPASQTLSTGLPYYHLSHDFTTSNKPYSRCLPNRSYITRPNSVAQNLCLSAGYYIASLHLNRSSCAPPLLLKRLDAQADKNEVVLSQIETVLTHSDLPFQDMLTLFTADSAYGKSRIISPLYAYDNMICILRMRAGMKVWTTYKGKQKTSGAPRIYDEKYYLRLENKTHKDTKSGIESLQIGIGTLEASQIDSYLMTMKNGREVIVEMKRWNDVLIRSKGTANMKDKPMDLLHVGVRDKESGEPVFDRPMFLAITGKQKSELASIDAQQSYRRRFNVEGAYRFMKQNLAFESLQSPEISHQDAWLHIAQLSYWLLYVASKEIAEVKIPEWQKYLKCNKNDPKDPLQKRRITLSQAQKSVATLFCTFDKKPFLPQKCKKGKGRAEGTKMTPRDKHPIVKKSKKEVLKC